QRLRFVPWLLSAISSGNYRGLCWTDPSRKAFRLPWKHKARKDPGSPCSSHPYTPAQAWAEVSGRYEGHTEDPAKWKTNFRCALRSTHMFLELEDHSKCGDDPHKVFAIVSGEPGPVGRGGAVMGVVMGQVQLGWGYMISHLLFPLSSDRTNPTQPPILEGVEELQWVLQHCDISPRDLDISTSSWVPPGNAPHQDALLQPHTDDSQNTCLPMLDLQQRVSAVEQPPFGAYQPLDTVLLGDQAGAVPLSCTPSEVLAPVPSPGEAMLFVPAASPMPPPLLPEETAGGPIQVLDVSIYYRGKLFHQEEVRSNPWLLAYHSSDPALALWPGQLVRFPSPAELADCKQRRYTEELLNSAGLQLETRAFKLFATRLKKCKVFWALSKQLEGVRAPPSNLLCRDQETLIFDFSEFCTELRDFRNVQRQQSPDFTIYLCFGQSFSSHKPKESKLILVKLVPKFCEYWYEQVLREGVSSLDSGTVSLQLSDSFSLFELIEQYNMQVD
ncbi:IRF3 factor, partial [Zapornia atra]|nr:IRF3 factor [Zapornia atra]